MAKLLNIVSRFSFLVNVTSFFTVKFYPDISASDQAIQIAIARNFRKCERESACSQAISREQILPGSDLGKNI